MPIESAGPRLPPAYRLIALDRVESTNDEAKRLAESGAEEGTLVWAREQTKGRGRQDRDFASPPGNLYMSLVLRPECLVAEAAQLSFVAALGVGDGVGSAAPPMIEVHYKWPNDVLFNGRKGSGILLESKISSGGGLEWLVLGIGVNLSELSREHELSGDQSQVRGGAARPAGRAAARGDLPAFPDLGAPLARRRVCPDPPSLAAPRRRAWRGARGALVERAPAWQVPGTGRKRRARPRAARRGNPADCHAGDVYFA